MCGALLRLDPTASTLTSVHLRVVSLCLDTRMYAAALPVLDHAILALPTALNPDAVENNALAARCYDEAPSRDYIHAHSGHSDRMGTREVQEYFLLGAMAYTGVRQFAKAKLMLERVLVTPVCQHTNALMLEAYRKWVLVSCLAQGTVGTVSLSRDASSQLQADRAPRGRNKTGAKPMPTAKLPPWMHFSVKDLQGASRPYEFLAESFQSMDVRQLGAYVTAGSAFWMEVRRLCGRSMGTAWADAARHAQDGNLGLVNELVPALQRNRVARLRQIYTAVPLTTVARMLASSVADTEAYVAQLVHEGAINAAVEHHAAPTGAVLRFFLDATTGPLAQTERQQCAHMQQLERQMQAVVHAVQATGHAIDLRHESIDELWRKQYTARNDAPGAADPGGDGDDTAADGTDTPDPMDATFDNDDDDENLLSDSD